MKPIVLMAVLTALFSLNLSSQTPFYSHPTTVDEISETEKNTANCCNNINIYGNLLDDVPYRIKSYNGFTYLAATTAINGTTTVATFSKFDTNNMLIWEYQFNVKSRIADFTMTDNGDFLLVGQLPISTSNYRSLLAKVDDNGNLLFTKVYENNAREGFNRIIKHPFPVDPSFPFYIAGHENVSNNPSYDDNSHLHNIDANGNVKWSVEYKYGQDTQIFRSMTPMANGNLLMAGNSVFNPASYLAVLVKVDGLNGSILHESESNVKVVYQGCTELSDGSIVVSGIFDDNNTYNAMLSLLDSNLNHLHSIRVSNGDIRSFSTLDRDAANNLYASGTTKNGMPIICKAFINGSQIKINTIKYFEDGETSFSNPNLYVSGSNLYYTDARVGHPKSIGSKDVLFGYFNTALTEDCLSDTSFVFTPPVLSFAPISINSVNFNLQLFNSSIGLVAQTFTNEPVCIATPCPDLSPVLTVLPSNITGNSQVNIVIRISEVNNVDTDGSIISVIMPSDQRTSFVWDIGLTQVGTIPVNNASWNYLGDNGILHRWEYNGPGLIINANATSSLGIQAFYDPQGTSGQTSITASVIPLSGGECNLTNNVDGEMLIYFD